MAKSAVLSLTTSLVLMLSAYPILSIGSMNGSTWQMLLGLILLSLGGLIPLIRRHVNRKQPPGEPDHAGMPEDVRVS